MPPAYFSLYMVDRYERARCIRKVELLAKKIGVPTEETKRATKHCSVQTSPFDGESTAKEIVRTLFHDARGI